VRLTPIVPNGSWPVYHRDEALTGDDPSRGRASFNLGLFDPRPR
jgi:hypothetical protein